MISKKDIEVKINSKTRQVFFDDNFLGLNGENLQGNIIFSFVDSSFVDGMAILEIEQDGKKYYIMPLDKEEETYKIVVKSSLLTTPQILMQLVIVEDETSLGSPKFKSKTFHMNVYESINATETIPDQYPSLEGLIKEALEIIVKDGDGYKFLSDDGTYREIQGAGTTNYEKLNNKPKINNVELEGDKSLDELGIQPKGNYLTEIPEEYIDEEEFSELTKDFATKEFVGNEISKIENIIVVNELPATGVPNKIYFVPKADTQTQDLFDEYVWINGKWEWITTKQIEVDLSNYYNKDEIDKALSNVSVDLSDYYDKNETEEVANQRIKILNDSDFEAMINEYYPSWSEETSIRFTIGMLYVKYGAGIYKVNTTRRTELFRGIYYGALFIGKGSIILILDEGHSSIVLNSKGTASNCIAALYCSSNTIKYDSLFTQFEYKTNVFFEKLDNLEGGKYLEKDNTTAYTPTADYHPATKKYVDDSVANVDIDLTDYYTKEETNEIANERIKILTSSEINEMANEFYPTWAEQNKFSAGMLYKKFGVGIYILKLDTTTNEAAYMYRSPYGGNSATLRNNSIIFVWGNGQCIMVLPNHGQAGGLHWFYTTNNSDQIKWDTYYTDGVAYTSSVFPNLENLFGNKYALKTDIDLTSYYNKDEVDELLENLDVDLTDYYTKDETDQKITENVGDINTVLATLVSVVADEEEY